ncbi:MAG TPA: hypothetical protein VI893_00550, partial [Thermoplasmata archaeon]|nr:hypothetical protein [Thermoplasmata archaeon]
EPSSIAFDKAQSGRFKVKPFDAKGNLLIKFQVNWVLAGDPVGALDPQTGNFTASSAGEAVVRATVTAGSVVMSAEAKVTVRGGIADIKGGGQLPYLLAGLAGLAAVATIILLRKRKQSRKRKDSQGYVPVEAGLERPEAQPASKGSAKGGSHSKGDPAETDAAKKP